MDFRPLLGSSAGISALHGNRVCLARSVQRDVRHLVHALSHHLAWQSMDGWPSPEIQQQGQQLLAAIDIICSWKSYGPFSIYGTLDPEVVEEVGQSWCTKEELSIAL